MKTRAFGFLQPVFVAVALAITRCDAAAAPAVIVFGPSEAEMNLDGNSVFRPFDPASPGRFQQVYSSTLFSGLPPEGGLISGLCFRIDANLGHSFAATLPSLQIHLSTTSRAIDGLSSVFSENIGADDTTVLGPQSVSLGGLGGGGSTGFDICFTFLSSPFYFNPANGNLLLDLRIQGFGPIGPPQGVAILDAFDVTGDGVSSVYGLGTTSFPATGNSSSLGLATVFGITPVPEPSTWALAIVGIVILTVLRKRKKQKEVDCVPR